MKRRRKKKRWRGGRKEARETYCNGPVNVENLPVPLVLKQEPSLIVSDDLKVRCRGRRGRQRVPVVEREIAWTRHPDERKGKKNYHRETGKGRVELRFEAPGILNQAKFLKERKKKKKRMNICLCTISFSCQRWQQSHPF